MRWLLVTLMLSLAACAKKEESKSTPVPTKSVFSVWTRTSNNFQNDFSQFKPNVMGVYYAFVANGEKCGYNILFTGDAVSGRFSLTNGVYLGGGSGSDPGCVQGNDAGTYSVSIDNKLSMCTDGATTCNEYL